MARRSLQLRQACLADDDLLVADSLHVMAKVYASRQDYKQALALHHHVLAIRERRLGSKDIQVARSLNGMGLVYEALGQHERAASLFDRAVRIMELEPNRGHDNYPSVLSNYGNLSTKLRLWAQSERQHRRAHDLWVARFGPQHWLVGVARHNLGELYAAMGRLRESLIEFTAAIDIWRQAFGDSHPHIASAIAAQAGVLLDLGVYAQAERGYKEALSSLQPLLGGLHPEVGRIHRGLAVLYSRMGRFNDACQQAEQAIDLLDDFLRNQGHALPEEQYAQFVDSVREQEDAMYTAFAPHIVQPCVARVALSMAMHGKGRTLEAAASLSQAINRDLSLADREKNAQLRGLRSQISSLTLVGPSEVLPADVLRQRLSELTQQASRLEEDLAQRSAVLREQRRMPRGMGLLEGIRRALPPGAALVEYVVFGELPQLSQTAPLSPPQHYLVFALTPGGELHAADLGSSPPLEATVKRYHAALRDPRSSAATSQALGLTLYRQLLEPVSAGFRSASQLLFSLDGALHTVPLSGLFDGSQMLYQRYLHSYLTSGRDLLRQRAATSEARDVVVVANPDFGGHAPLLPGGTATARTARRRQRFFIDQLLPLPGTQVEALSIQRLFPAARLLLGEVATESALLSLAPPAILHIATHGLFLEDRARQPSGRLRHSHFSEGDVSLPAHPLLRSALLLAGAGAPRKSTGRGEADGVVTALELSSMNLWGTQLVVLSACNSGRGMVRMGQGVYGLRHALLAAGAESIITSLWKVDDHVTQELMTDFYRHLKAGRGRAEALLLAQSAIRARYPHPYFWASFVLSGEIGALRLAQ